MDTFLHILGLALCIDKNRRSHIREVLPRICRIQGMIIAHRSIVQTSVAVVVIPGTLAPALVVLVVAMTRLRTRASAACAIQIVIVTGLLEVATLVLITIAASTTRICNAKLANRLAMLLPPVISLRKPSSSPSI